MVVVASVAFVVAILYFAQDVLLPFALAVLLSFVLTPLVTRLERCGLGRIPAVIATAVVAFAILGGIGWVVTAQLIDLTRSLPKYEATLIQKIESVREALGGPSPLAETLQDLRQAATGGQPEETDVQPVPVQVVQNVPLPLRVLRDWLGPLLAPLGTAAIVIVFVMFILIQREDLRDRLIRLAGTGRIYVTTQALDEAAARVSRYLLMQLVINATYGVAVAIGLSLIGLPNALLWGLLSAIVRFIPYIGPWVGAALPIALSVAVFEGWMWPLVTAGFFVALELFSNNVMEPWLYGASTGVSVVGIIVSAVFWTWLWGPIGLVLATPLTVCLTVLGRYVPSLNFLNVLFSDEPALELSSRFYQRLLAFDEHEANDLVGDFLKTGSLDELYEQLVIPALSVSERDRHAGHLSENQLRFIHRFVSDLISGLGEEFRMAAAEQAVPEQAATESDEPDTAPAKSRSLRILCVPAEDRADRLAGRMLAQLLSARGHFAEAVGRNLTTEDLTGLVDRKHADVLVISALAPGGAIQSRDGCRRLRPAFPDLRILVGLWNARGPLERTVDRMHSAGADSVITSLTDGLRWVEELASTAEPERPEHGPQETRSRTADSAKSRATR